ncbi:MAG: YHS domain-containing protein, partial [Myxococcales bacterium]|nr:YHS domain-containing protein [Myxococcales bacterium]
MTKESHAHSRSDPPGAQLRDPVCGMVVEEDAKHRHEHAGEIHRFCSSGCREKFAADPTRYLESREPAGVEVSEGTVYTCPMHPEVEQV